MPPNTPPPNTPPPNPNAQGGNTQQNPNQQQPNANQQQGGGQQTPNQQQGADLIDVLDSLSGYSTIEAQVKQNINTKISEIATKINDVLKNNMQPAERLSMHKELRDRQAKNTAVKGILPVMTGTKKHAEISPGTVDAPAEMVEALRFIQARSAQTYTDISSVVGQELTDIHNELNANTQATQNQTPGQTPQQQPGSNGQNQTPGQTPQQQPGNNGQNQAPANTPQQQSEGRFKKTVFWPFRKTAKAYNWSHKKLEKPVSWSWGKLDYLNIFSDNFWLKFW